VRRESFGNWGGGVMAPGTQLRGKAKSADELLTVAQMCAELGGISRRTFYRWREVGTGPQCLKIPNGELRAWRSDFSTWLESLREGAA
jgi:predicted DNA-binding transcriptional regulator AlpA